jgi:hypothetical protein
MTDLSGVCHMLRFSSVCMCEKRVDIREHVKLTDHRLKLLFTINTTWLNACDSVKSRLYRTCYPPTLSRLDHTTHKTLLLLSKTLQTATRYKPFILPFTMLPPAPPPSFDIPAFKYRPEYGSHGAEPCKSYIQSVSATSPRGGYPDVDNSRRDMTDAQQHNTLRLISLVWGYNSSQVIRSILGIELPRNHKTYLSNLIRVRLGALPSNPIYHMVQESVESYDLGVNIRDLARTAALCKVAVPGESQAMIDRRQEIAAEYQAASYELRDRAVAHINQQIADLPLVNMGFAGASQSWRLKRVCVRFQVDPFENLDVQQGMELHYSERTKEDRRTFWLARYESNVVAWYWAFRGVVDIHETIAEEPMATYSREEFAYVCDAMWTMVTGKEGPATSHQAAYRKACGGFNDFYNYELDAGLAVNDGPVRSLKFIKVTPHSFSSPNGYLKSVTGDYTAAVEHEYRAEHAEDEF